MRGSEGVDFSEHNGWFGVGDVRKSIVGEMSSSNREIVAVMGFFSVFEETKNMLWWCSGRYQY